MARVKLYCGDLTSMNDYRRLYTTLSTCLALMLTIAAPSQLVAETTEFCLDGEFNLGARYQGTEPGVDEFVPTRWCVVTEDDGERVLFEGRGKSNPDMYGQWKVAMLPPDTVRIINDGDRPDVEFLGADGRSEALLIRRIDPRRLAEEFLQGPIEGLRVNMDGSRVQAVQTSADLPLRGRVPVSWQWNWTDESRPTLTLLIEDDVLFRATGAWRTLEGVEAASLWRPGSKQPPVEVPGENWPARIHMERVDLAEGVALVRGVRTGFQHLVVDTDVGLVVGDAPAGWVELHQLPPTDLVPGMGVSGLSERFIDFLAETFPGRPLRAVALTHPHDDHAGGARAFAAAGAEVFAPAASAVFLEQSLNRGEMPPDRLSLAGDRVELVPVDDVAVLDDSENPVRLVSIGPGPHGTAALGVHVPISGHFFVSDIHVPRSEDAEPSPERAASECHFAAWAVVSLPAETVVLNSHSAFETPISRLAKYLDSAACRELPE